MILKNNLYFPITRAGQDPAPTHASYRGDTSPTCVGADLCIRPREGTECRIRLNPECFIYKAHFPGQAVTPGVCLVQIAVELLGDAVGRNLKIKRMKEAKFLSVVSPETCPELNVNIVKMEETDGEISAKMTIVGGGEVKAKISVCCE